MSTFTDDIRRTFRQGDIIVKFIFLNAGIFCLTALLQIALTLFNLNADSILSYVKLPASVATLLRQPWSLLTYMFVHANAMHLMFNMLWLFWMGHIALQSFSSKHIRGLYILGGLLGGALYMLTYNIFPYFSDKVDYSYMVGASASVLAIVTAAAYRTPDYTVNLMFIGTVRLKYIALGIVLMDLLFATSDNAGGHIAHLGGAATGLLFAWMLDRGTDLTAWLNAIADAGTGQYAHRPRQRKPKMKYTYGKQTAEATRPDNGDDTRQARIDRILDKIRQSGYQSLTDEEKKELFNAGKN